MQKEARSEEPRENGVSPPLQARVFYRSAARVCGRGLTLFPLGFWLLASFCLHAEIIDRIVAAVEGRIVTLSDLRQEREIRARLGDKPIDDKALIRDLIENYLIESQMADFPGVEVTDSEIDADPRKLQQPNAPLAPTVREALRKRIQMAKYFEVRFRQFLRASDEEIRKYYDEVFVPEVTARGLTPVPPLEQVADTIRKNIIEEKLDHDVNIWLEAIRRRSDVEIFE
jgi:hypothetical protein